MPSERSWNLFEGAVVTPLFGRIHLLTVPGRDDFPRPVFVIQNGLGQPMSVGANECTAAELRAMADFIDQEQRLCVDGGKENDGPTKS